MFNANPVPVERMRINQFLKVEPPINRILIDLENRLQRFSEIVQDNANITDYVHDDSEEIHIIANTMKKDPETNSIERGVAALLAFHNRHADTPEEESPLQVEEVETDDSRIHLFDTVKLDEDIQDRVGTGDLARFSAPLINKAYIKDKVELLERVMGRSGSQASSMTSEIVKDMLNATDYPPEVEGLFLPIGDVTLAAQQLAEYVESLQTPPE
jgi:intracellular multiplication protein IcmO